MVKIMPDTANSAKAPRLARDLATLQGETRALRSGGARLGFVPTMGALHDGHLELVRHAKTLCDKVAVSIFVNPLQFAPTEDLDRYPRQEAADIALLQSVGCDLVYLPTPEVLYPKGFVSRLTMEGPALGLETDFRPQFFGGVMTVVMKLFNQVRPDVAVFGEKDYQQLAVIRAMVRDFDMGIDVVGHPTVREGDGLALSSRNAYLKPAERAAAPRLNQVLKDIAAAGDVDVAISKGTDDLLATGFAKVDYLTVRDAETLGPARPGYPRRALAAAWMGQTRLIDNIPA